MQTFSKTLSIAVFALIAASLVLIFLPFILLFLLISVCYALIGGHSIRSSFLNIQNFRQPHHGEKSSANQNARPFQRPAPDDTVYDIDCKVLDPDNKTDSDAENSNRGRLE